MVSLAIILGFFTPRWRIVVMIMIPKAKAAKASRVLYPCVKPVKIGDA